MMGRWAGAPIFGDLFPARDAELLVKASRRKGAQHFLVENRDLAPLVIIVEPVEVDVIELPTRR